MLWIAVWSQVAVADRPVLSTVLLADRIFFKSGPLENPDLSFFLRRTDPDTRYGVLASTWRSTMWDGWGSCRCMSFLLLGNLWLPTYHRVIYWHGVIIASVFLSRRGCLESPDGVVGITPSPPNHRGMEDVNGQIEVAAVSSGPFWGKNEDSEKYNYSARRSRRPVNGLHTPPSMIWPPPFVSTFPP